MKERNLRRQATERRGHGVEFHLLDLRLCVRFIRVKVDHVIRAKEAEGQVLDES